MPEEACFLWFNVHVENWGKQIFINAQIEQITVFLYAHEVQDLITGTHTYHTHTTWWGRVEWFEIRFDFASPGAESSMGRRLYSFIHSLNGSSNNHIQYWLFQEHSLHMTNKNRSYIFIAWHGAYESRSNGLIPAIRKTHPQPFNAFFLLNTLSQDRNTQPKYNIWIKTLQFPILWTTDSGSE